MKRQKQMFLCIVIILLNVGCRNGAIETPEPAQTTVAATSTSRPSNENTPVNILTAAPITPTPQRPTASPTPTEVPILSVEAAQKRLKALLADNGGCRLPCLWGIIPGVSSHVDGEEILIPLSSISNYVDFIPVLGDISPALPIGDTRISLRVAYVVSNSVVSGLYFQARALEEYENERESGSRSVYDSDSFGEHLRLFMLPQILNEYGAPESVVMFTFQEVPPARYGDETFQIVLLYPDQGILVEYTTQMRVEGKNVLGCLSNAHIEMELHPAGNRELFFEQIAPSWQSVIDHYTPLEEATSMTPEEFYETFRQSTGQCLETPSEIWPIAEN